MAIIQVLENQSNDSKNEQHHQLEELTPESKELLASLPKEKGWRTPNLFFYQGFWCQPKEIQAIVSLQKHYKAEDTDIIVATIPKSGTTWLKALCFAVVNRGKYPPKSNHPLLTHNPHDLVPFLEYKLFTNRQIPDMSGFPKPRLLGTHVPISALPDSVRDTKCKLVYMARNPFDTFVSIWHFLNKLRPDSMGPFSLEEGFDMYCRGAIGFGPYWEHMLGYWNESLENPDKVLFLKYEDTKENTSLNVRKLAEFLGYPFTAREEEDGVVEEIVKLCSFEIMKELEVNKIGKDAIGENFENKNLFRKAEVGDWVNYFTPLMVERLNSVMEEKMAGTGLTFKVI